MKLPWFRKVGIVFFPLRPAGWIIALAAVIIAIFKFIDIDRRSHSASDTLINFVFYLIIIGIFYSIVGYITSRPGKE